MINLLSFVDKGTWPCDADRRARARAMTTTLSASLVNATERMSLCDAAATDPFVVGVEVAFGALLLGGFLFCLCAGKFWRYKWRRMVHNAFDAVDCDGSGKINTDELYSAVLKLYILLPVRCPPPTRMALMIMISQHDTDDSGDIELEEFTEACRTPLDRPPRAHHASPD